VINHPSQHEFNYWIALIDIVREGNVAVAFIKVNGQIKLSQKYFTMWNTIKSFVACKKNLPKDAMSVYHAKLC